MNVIFLHSSRNKRTNYILHVTISYISLVITQSLILMQFYWLLYVMVQNHSRQLSITPVYVTINYFCTMIISRVSIFHLCYWLLLIHGRKLRVWTVILTTKSWSHMLLEKVQKRQQNLLSICNMKIYGRVAKYSLWVWRATTNLPSWTPQSQEILT